MCCPKLTGCANSCVINQYTVKHLHWDRPPSDKWTRRHCINFPVILRYLCLCCRSALSGHNTTPHTRRQFQCPQPCTVSAVYTANTGPQPEHDTWQEEGTNVLTRDWSISTVASQSVPQKHDIILLHLSQYVIRHCWQAPENEGYSRTHTSRIPIYRVDRNYI
jgi:hypothetical protein